MRDPEIIVQIQNRVGRLTLNRPKSLHALNLNMCLAMTRALKAWAKSSKVDFVLVDHLPGSRGFCAGGDVRMLAESGVKDGVEARNFFEAEYRLNETIKRFPKPYVALIDGVVMGGGVGISVHGSHRIATPRTVFAMPETGIGLFPDVGGTWFLPRLKGQLGTWLALTGERLKGPDVLAAGIATHYYNHMRMDALVEGLISDGLIALNACETSAELSIADNCAEMDACFRGDCVREIGKQLRLGSRWARDQATKLEAKSPLSLKITLKQMRLGAILSGFRDALKIEYRIATRLVQTENFREGVRAVLVDRDHQPDWYPASLLVVSKDRVLDFFAPLNQRELTFQEVEK